MNKRELVIGYIKEEGRKHPILAWLNYGIVIPSLVTTNGSIPFCAQYLYDVLNYDDADNDIKIVIADVSIRKEMTKKEIENILLEEYILAKQHMLDMLDICSE